MATVKLQAADGETVLSCSTEAARMSGTLKDLIDDMGVETTIPVARVQAPVLQKVIDFCEQHKKDKAKDEDDKGEKKFKSELADWDKEFCAGMDNPLLFHVVQAADFLRCQALLDVTTLAIALKLKGKTVEEVKREFALKPQ